MWSLLFGMYLVSAASAASPPQGPPLGMDCECFCVEGQLKTLCSTLVPAKASVDLCHRSADCTMPLAEPFSPEAYDTSTQGAENCRSARVWRRNFEDHQVVKICDT
jgi:hypothetical protein